MFRISLPEPHEALAWGQRRKVRFAARAAAVAFLLLSIAHAVVRGGYLDYDGSPWARLPGKMAELVGLGAGDIKIEGLVRHDPETVLSAIDVTPGGSLIGFDAGLARRILENLDWVKSAKVQRLFPNQLEISVVEREPFAIWQRDDVYYVIDRDGVAMSGVPASQLVSLPLVTGEGAQRAAAELINQLEATPGILLQLRAAARVGDRRWTLYLDNGVKILLPEKDWAGAIAEVQKLDETQQLLSKGIRSIDLRLPGRISVAVAEVTPEAELQHEVAKK
ncbi:MAG: FtsQ-type POTRA domain-containing protein [Rhizobiales bacterium]|nr:FtsQ-type POTRA domain-containing protein [Hyphomicrobiales bacterium]